MNDLKTSINVSMTNKYFVLFDSVLMGCLVGIGYGTICFWFGGDRAVQLVIGCVLGGYSAWSTYKNAVSIANAKMILARGGR